MLVDLEEKYVVLRSRSTNTLLLIPPPDRTKFHSKDMSRTILAVLEERSLYDKGVTNMYLRREEYSEEDFEEWYRGGDPTIGLVQRDIRGRK